MIELLAYSCRFYAQAHRWPLRSQAPTCASAVIPGTMRMVQPHLTSSSPSQPLHLPPAFEVALSPANTLVGKRTSGADANAEWLLSASGVVGLAHATRPATRALSRALPRRRALWTNWKKPR